MNTLLLETKPQNNEQSEFLKWEKRLGKKNSRFGSKLQIWKYNLEIGEGGSVVIVSYAA